MRCLRRVPSLHAVGLLGTLAFTAGILMRALTTSLAVMPKPEASTNSAPLAVGGTKEMGGEDDRNSDAVALHWQRHTLALQTTQDSYFTLYDFSKDLMYTNTPHTLGRVAREPTELERAWLVEVQHRAAAALGSDVRPQHCTSVRYRLLEGQGVEVEVSCTRQSGTPVSVSLLQRLTPAKVVGTPSSPEPLAPLHIAMALSGRLETLQIFLSSLQSILRSHPQNVVLTVVYFEDGKSQQVASALQQTRLFNHGLQTELFIEQGPFSRARGLRLALQKTAAVGPHVVTWLCDVDMLFTAEFIGRCRSTPQLGKQMFFPVVFSQFNPSLLHHLGSDKAPLRPFDVKVKESQGYWRIFGYGNVCAYRQDLLIVKTFEGVNKITWGEEDIKLLENIVSFGRHRIVRSLEPGLIHQYHPKKCKDLPKELEPSCLKVRIANEASQKTFGLLYFGQLAAMGGGDKTGAVPMMGGEDGDRGGGNGHDGGQG